MKPPFYVELNEERHVYMRDGKPIFLGRPDLVRRYPKLGVTVVLDRKFGRGEVPPADVNMQLRCYLVMLPLAELEDAEGKAPAIGVEEEFRPSSLLRFSLCPGSLALERSMTAQGLWKDDRSEDAAEGTRLHRAASEPLSPRDDLKPEQMDVVEKSERMEADFFEFILAQDPLLPFYGAIIQPRCANKADIVFYTGDDIATAKKEIDEIWDAAHQENAPRYAGEIQCQFCPCKPICAEYRAWIMALEKLQHMPSVTWTSEQWDMFLSRRRELAKFLEDRYEDAKKIIEAMPDTIPGWVLEPGDEVRHVTDIPAAYTAFKGIMDAKQFSGCCRVSVGDMEEVIYQARRNTPQKITQKEAKQIVNVTLHGLIERKRKGPSLVRKALP
jgi:hypothetical protein